MGAPGPGTDPNLPAIDDRDREDDPPSDDEAAAAIAEFEDERTALTEDRQLSSEKVRAIKLREKVRKTLDELGGEDEPDSD